MLVHEKLTKLPKPNFYGAPLEQIIRKRRSIRDYSSKPMTIPQLSQLLFAAQGITATVGGESRRAAPSAGATYPIEIYIVVNCVTDLSQGVYHYRPVEHILKLVTTGDFRNQLIEAGPNKEKLGQAAVVFALAAVFSRTCEKYGDRGICFVNIEAGHISQNIHLQAVSLGLGSLSVGAFIDKKINNLIGVDGNNETVIYLNPVGYIKNS